MKVSAKSVISFYYSLRDDQDNHLESNKESDQQSYLMGSGGLLKGLEKAFQDRQQGDKFTVNVDPIDGYGFHNPELIQRIAAKHLQGKGTSKTKGQFKAGQIAQLNTKDGLKMVTVIKSGRNMLTVDANHPYAGKNLVFDIELMEVRQATSEEIAHDHVHGPGGHHH